MLENFYRWKLCSHSDDKTMQVSEPISGVNCVFDATLSFACNEECWYHVLLHDCELNVTTILEYLMLLVFLFKFLFKK